MAGLNLGVMGGVRASSTAGTTGSNPVSATQAAYGPGYSDTGTPSASSALTPNDPFGVAFWAGVTCLGLLLLIRHSLPN